MMIRSSDPAILLATAIVSVAVGFGAATLMPSREKIVQPIIQDRAWEASSPAPAAVQVTTVANSTPRCSQWAISDVAMEEVLDEMIRRGWRPPNQGEAIAMLDDARTVGLGAADPDAPMPSRNARSSTTASISEDTAEDAQLTGGAAPEPAAQAVSPPPPPA